MSDQTIMQAQLFSMIPASAAIRTALADRAQLQRMLDFELALARAEAAVGVIPSGALGAIADACKAERYDPSALAIRASESGTTVAHALLASLTETVAGDNPRAADHVHFGASLQDLADTALMLDLRAVIDVLLNDIDRATRLLIELAGRHRRSGTVARTDMQQALPMPLGLRFANYAAALARSRDRLRRLRREALVLQFGGSAGTLAALGERGIDVSERLAALLNLPLPDAPWHSQRDRLAEIAAAMAILTGSCGKIARDIVLAGQTEIGEILERPATDRRSELPQQHDVGLAAAVLAAATAAPNLAATAFAAQVQEYERPIGGGQAECVALLELASVTAGALDAICRIVDGLQVDTVRLRANLERSGGRIMAEALALALASRLGRGRAHDLVAELCRRADAEGRPLREIADADPQVSAVLSTSDVARLVLPVGHQGSSQTFIERLVGRAQGRALQRPPTPPLDEPQPATQAPTANAASSNSKTRSSEHESSEASTPGPASSEPDLPQLPAAVSIDTVTAAVAELKQLGSAADDDQGNKPPVDDKPTTTTQS